MTKHRTDLQEDAAQVNIDYIAGLSIFILTVAFVFQFINGLSTSFSLHKDEVMLASIRANTVLVDRLLASDRQGLVDSEKLDHFMNTNLNRSQMTSGRTNYELALAELGLSGSDTVFDVNISVTYLNGTIMYNGGPALPDNAGFGQTRRLVLVVNSSTGYQETAFISMRAW